MTVTLLLIDVQRDFHPGGSLAIPTAYDDAKRIATFIETNNDKINRIIATMDTHPKIHIAHSTFWINSSTGKHPDPFTIITTNDIETGIWHPRNDLVIEPNDFDPTIFNQSELVLDTNNTLDIVKYCTEYTKRLEESGKFLLCIWPEHCLLGSTGHAIVDIVTTALDKWTTKHGRNVSYILKGQNQLTEMFSVMSAEVPVSKETSFNIALQEQLQSSCSPINTTSGSSSTTTNTIVVAGQAMSHCVNYSVRDIVQHWNKDDNNNNNNNTTQFFILTDCMSPVPGFEQAAQQFQSDLSTITSPVIKFIKSTDLTL